MVGVLVSRRQADPLCRRRARTRDRGSTCGTIPSGAPRPVTPEGFFAPGMTRTVSPDGRSFLAVQLRRRLDLDLPDRRRRAAPRRRDRSRTRAPGSLDRGRSRPLHPGLEGPAVPDLRASTSASGARVPWKRIAPSDPAGAEDTPARAPLGRRRGRASTRSPASSRRSTSWTGSGSPCPRATTGSSCCGRPSATSAGRTSPGSTRSEWKHAKEKLTAEDARARSRASPSAWKRWFLKTANASSSASPSGWRRRAASCSSSCSLCFLLSIFRPAVRAPRREGRARRAAARPSYHVDFDSGFLLPRRRC